MYKNTLDRKTRIALISLPPSLSISLSLSLSLSLYIYI